MISNLAQIKAVPIEQVVAARGVKLMKGNKACCPIHGEKSPSFHVNARRQFFKCFGCGVGGDSIAFVMAMDKCDFPQALEIIAQIGGITIEIDESQREAYSKKKEAQRGIRETLVHALNQYSLLLQQSETAQQYLQLRRISPETAQLFRLGYAPDSWNFLTEMIVGHQSPEHAAAIGLIREKEKGGFYDCFRNRLIFPYLNEYGEPVSLSGRYCETEATPRDQQTPKTQKGNNSDLFDNESYLYGLYQAEAGIKEHKCALCVEGEVDVIQMHQAGAVNTIGIGNNHLKEAQCRVLKRYTDHLVFVPDHDIKEKDGKIRNPGFEAFEKNLRMALAYGFKVDVFELPAGMDPDDFAKTFISEPEREFEHAT